MTLQSVWQRPKATKPPPLDPATLVICNDPIPAHRASPKNKYHAIFNGMKPGQALKCEPYNVNRVANALRKHIETKALKCVARSITDYGDGMGRVWLMPADKKVNLK